MQNRILLHSVKTFPHPKEVYEFEEQEMAKSWSFVKDKLKMWYDWLEGYVPKPIKSVVSTALIK